MMRLVFPKFRNTLASWISETTGVEIEENDPQIADEYPVMAAIGQSNNNYATIQLGRYVSAIANDGNVYEYTLLSKVCDSDGNTWKPMSRSKKYGGCIRYHTMECHSYRNAYGSGKSVYI